jgi:hypothetical protein
VNATKPRSEVPIGARVRWDQNKKPRSGSLPDGKLDCSACGSEVQPLGTSSTPFGSRYRGEANWAGWVDGGFKETGSSINNPNLARWATLSERFDHYHGHRAGRKARRRRSGGLPKAHERSLGRTRAYRKGGIAMATARSLWGQHLSVCPGQVGQEEKVLQYSFRSGELVPNQHRQTGRA